MALDDEPAPVAPHLPTARPALLALAVAVAVSLAMLSGAIVFAQRSTDRTRLLVDDALRSMQLVGALRNDVFQLLDRPEPPELDAIASRVEASLRAYKPLAKYPGEAEELARLEPVISTFVRTPPDAPEKATIRKLLRYSFTRLSEINRYEVERTLQELAEAHRHALLAQILVAIVVLCASGLAALSIHRVVQRQRTAIANDVHRLSEQNRDLAAFAGRTAHDLRGPLTPIRGYADMLTMGGADIPRAAAQIRHATERMSETIENLLALALSGHPPAGTTHVEPVLREVLAELATGLAGADIVMTIEDCSIACAPAVLRQALYNVTDNASKYRSPERTLALHIEGKRVRDQFEISIEDNGLGMSADAVARVFEPYYRAPATRSQPGTGLGLPIVRRTIEAIGGQCELASELGRGTRFVIRVPVA